MEEGLQSGPSHGTPQNRPAKTLVEGSSRNALQRISEPHGTVARGIFQPLGPVVEDQRQGIDRLPTVRGSMWIIGAFWRKKVVRREDESGNTSSLVPVVRRDVVLFEFRRCFY
jgi:hypothetical protein